MIIYGCEQRSLEWYRVRTGKITASSADRLTTPAKLKTYQYAVLAETLTGMLDETKLTDAMMWGIDQEDRAIEWYIKETNYKVKRVGFCQSEEMLIAGCSPDLLVGDEGLCEIKCPTSKNHLMQYVEGPDKDYIYQMQFQMLVTDRLWCDFVTFDPRFPEQLKGGVYRVDRDEKIIAKLKAGILEVSAFIDNFMMENNAHPWEEPIITESTEEDFYE